MSGLTAMLTVLLPIRAGFSYLHITGSKILLYIVDETSAEDREIRVFCRESLKTVGCCLALPSDNHNLAVYSCSGKRIEKVSASYS